MTLPRLYLSPPHVGDEERQLLLEAFDSNWIAPLGPHVDAFEREFAQAVGVAHSVALASGSAALDLALRTVGVRPGDRVVVSTLTFAASAFAACHVGAEPVFVDAEAQSWNMDPEWLKTAIEEEARAGRRVAAVVCVDLYGQCADYEAIRSICGVHGLPLIQDSAEALGARFNGAAAGQQGDLAVFSFNGNKIITTSGGGMLVSARKEWIDKARHWATQARDPAPHYQHSEVGHNYRMSNLLAAVGRAQLRSLPAKVARRREINRLYRRLLGHLPGIEFMPIAPWGEPNYWLTCITVNAAAFGSDREAIRLALEAENIESRPIWKPMHLQPVFAKHRVYGGGVSEALFRDGLCLPSGSAMTDADVERVASIIAAQHQ
jgi:pyridoxal phosphate-dependent aminotransferase EpsN